jgi:hypothetical protein
MQADFVLWLYAKAPERDEEAENIAIDLLREFRDNCVPEYLERIIVGESWTILSRRIVRGEDARKVAADLRGPGLAVEIHWLEPLAQGIDRAEIVTFIKRPNLSTLCRDDRLNRASIYARLEAQCRQMKVSEGQSGLTEGRKILQALLMRHEERAVG